MCPYKKSVVGGIVSKHIYQFPYKYPFIRLLQYMVMPDHIHLLLQVKELMPKSLGYYIGRLKAFISYDWSIRGGLNLKSNDIFMENFTDRIIYPHVRLDTVYDYIKENPHRLAMRIQFPRFFSRKRSYFIGGQEFEAYGNLFLLKNPFKRAVQIHRKYSDEQVKMITDEWISDAIDGAVLVSPFISQREKKVWESVDNMGGRMILLRHEPFGERYKPGGRKFRLCEEGRLVIVAPKENYYERLSREACLELNRLKFIAGED